MTLPVFRATPLPAVGPYRLAGPAGRHAAAVRRLRAGELVRLVDGAGGSAAGTVTAAGREHLDLQITEVRADPRPSPRLVVAQALPKGDRGELAVELLTEVGADELLPWSAARSVARWDAARAARGCERWQRVADAAAEQARRSWWPVVGPLASTAAVAARAQTADLAVVLHEEADTALAALSVPAGEVLLVVGPEGGIDAREVELLLAAGARPVRLGPEVLRTSSAGIAAAAALLARTTRWGGAGS